MTTVPVKNGNFEAAYKKFKNDQARHGTLSELKRRKYYTKPGVAKKEARENAIKNSRKMAKKEGRRDN